MEEPNDIIRNINLLEKNFLNQIEYKVEFRNAIYTIKAEATALKNEVNLNNHQMGDLDNEITFLKDQIIDLKQSNNKLRLLEAENIQLKKRNIPDTDDEEEGIINVIHDIQTDNDKTFEELSMFVQEKNAKINQLEQTNIQFKAENDRLKSELLLKQIKNNNSKIKTKDGYDKKIKKLEMDLKIAEKNYPIPVKLSETVIVTFDKVPDDRIENEVNLGLKALKVNDPRFSQLLEIKIMLYNIKTLKAKRDAQFPK